jgi:hypothetical protein
LIAYYSFFFAWNVQEKCVLIILKKEIVQSHADSTAGVRFLGYIRARFNLMKLPLKVARHCTQQAPKVSTTRAAWSARQSPHLIIKETAAGIVSC